jgi:hypothetical protein
VHLLYYVTGHGYGHGVRTAAICNELSPDVRLTFRTKLPEQFFIEEIKRPFHYAPEEFDCGCLQFDSVTTDIEKTFTAYQSIERRNAMLLDDEAAWCAAQGVTMIVSDATPFAFDVARRCGIPSVAVTNFTWYDIYLPYAKVNAGFLPLVERMKEQYGRADALLALEPALPMEYFRKRIEIPPVGRRGKNRRDEIAGKNGFDKRKHLALIYFGEFGMHDIDWRGLARFTEWEFLGLYPLPHAPSNYRIVATSEFSYQDLVASVDFMAGKLGYCTVAECMLHGTPIMYLPRTDFVEWAALDRAVRSWGGGYEVSPLDCRALRWKPVLDAVASAQRPECLQSDGARICAREIERFGNK